jgi:glycosyltransferase involved in cell wall biosynthesis
MPSILFIDAVTPAPYATSKLVGVGGTELTTTLIAEGFASRGYNVVVEQHNRHKVEMGDRVLYAPIRTADSADYVFCLRHPHTLLAARQRFPRAKLFLHLHDVAGRELGLQLKTIIETKATPVAVSQWHRGQIIETLRPFGFDGQFRIKVSYPPIADDLVPDDTSVDPHKLLFMSSPHKGLKNALEVFRNLLSFNGAFRLYVTNPGYLPNDGVNHPGVEVLGSLPVGELNNHLRSSLCVYYPNTVFPETFGRVFSEANAVGTPVIAHQFGASTEILDRPDCEVMDCRNPKTVIDRVLAWSSGNRPIVRGKKQYRLSRVINDLKRIMEE